MKSFITKCLDMVEVRPSPPPTVTCHNSMTTWLRPRAQASSGHIVGTPSLSLVKEQDSHFIFPSNQTPPRTYINGCNWRYPVQCTLYPPHSPINVCVMVFEGKGGNIAGETSVLRAHFRNRVDPAFMCPFGSWQGLSVAGKRVEQNPRYHSKKHLHMDGLKDLGSCVPYKGSEV
jgi:hypothetical protein